MENIYDNYYKTQVGNGITAYSGTRYQRGNGLFGKILKFLKPALNYIGRQGLMATSNMVSGLANGESFRNVAKNELLNRGKILMSDGIDKLNIINQKGNGRRKVAAKKKTKKTVKKTAKKITKKASKKITKKVITKTAKCKNLYKKVNKNLFL